MKTYSGSVADDFATTCWWCAGTTCLRRSALSFRDAGSKESRPCLVCDRCAPKLRPELRGGDHRADVPRGTNISLLDLGGPTR